MRAKLIGPIVALGLVAGACGSGSETSATTTDATPTTTSIPAQSDAVDDSDGRSAGPEAQPEPDPEPEPEPEEEPGPELDERTLDTAEPVCFAVSLWASAEDAVEFLDMENPGIVEEWFDTVDFRAAQIAGFSDDDTTRTLAEYYRENLAPVIDFAASYDYDVADRNDEFDERLAQNAEELNRVGEIFRDHLLGPCGYDEDRMRSHAEAVASDITDQVVVPPPPPDDPVVVADSEGVIEIAVPHDWAGIIEDPGPDSTTLVVSPDLPGYLNGWTASGIEVSTFPYDGSDLAGWGFQSRAGQDCELMQVDTYDDGVHTGYINLYESCMTASDATSVDTTGTSAATISAVDAEGENAIRVVLALTEEDLPLLPTMLLGLTINR